MARSKSFCAVALAATMSVAANQASADWREKYKTIKMGAITVETQGVMLARLRPLAEYMEKKLGVRVEAFSATDYAGVVQALSAGQVHLGRIGGAAYAAGYIDSKGGVEPLVMNVDADGGRGYHSVLIVRSDSPYKSIEDLKGKSLAWADPNSTSGYLVPNAALREAGIDAQKHFGRTVFSGGHEQNVIGMLEGQFRQRLHLDVARSPGRAVPDHDGPGPAQARRHPHHLGIAADRQSLVGSVQRHSRRYAEGYARHVPRSRQGQYGHGGGCRVRARPVASRR